MSSAAAFLRPCALLPLLCGQVQRSLSACRTLDLQARTTAEREEWVAALHSVLTDVRAGMNNMELGTYSKGRKKHATPPAAEAQAASSPFASASASATASSAAGSAAAASDDPPAVEPLDVSALRAQIRRNSAFAAGTAVAAVATSSSLGHTPATKAAELKAAQDAAEAAAAAAGLPPPPPKNPPPADTPDTVSENEEEEQHEDEDDEIPPPPPNPAPLPARVEASLAEHSISELPPPVRAWPRFVMFPF